MANGRVITGFSKPYIAIYSNTGTTVTYSRAQILARGVEVNIELESGENNDFYADNIIAETSGGVFMGGTLTLTVDGLLDEAESVLFGLPAPDSITVGDQSVSVQKYGSGQVIPFVGIGFVVRYMSGNVTSYVPIVLTKTKFQTPTISAATQGEEIEWQTQELIATIFRDDTSDQNWKISGAGQASESAAEAVILSLLGGSAK